MPWWIVLLAALAIAYLIFKFLVKPVIKVLAILALAVVVWLLLTNFL